MKRTPWLFLLGLLVVTPGCYRSPDITLHEPHEYKGKTDPLLALQQSEAQQKTLQERFQMVQTDR